MVGLNIHINIGGRIIHIQIEGTSIRSIIRITAE